MTARYNGQSAIGNVLPDDFVFNGKEHKPVVTMQDSQKVIVQMVGTMSILQKTHTLVLLMLTI